MRLWAIVATVLVACAPTLPVDLADGRRYVDDPAFRRQKLEAALVNPQNSYSKLRLAKYKEDGWGALPEWNPPAQRIHPNGGEEPYRSIDVDSVPWTREALIALGREAFFRYPVQIQDAASVGLKHPDAYGLWQSPDGVGGIVRTKVPVGPPHLAFSCATCHASPGNDGQVVAGLPNARLAMGAMLIDRFGGHRPDTWGRGRIDLTNDGIDNPVAIPDLRPVSSEHYLHHDGTVRNGLIELAIRIETLIITSNNETIRPPRKLVFAMALYLWGLQPDATGAVTDSSNHGAQLFKQSCEHCHHAPGYAGDLVSLATIGTDRTVGDIPERTTGSYRIPSLRGVSDRTPLLASGQVPSIDVLLDPQRTIPGHRYGLSLGTADRQDLLAFLRTLK